MHIKIHEKCLKFTIFYSIKYYSTKYRKWNKYFFNKTHSNKSQCIYVKIRKVGN